MPAPRVYNKHHGDAPAGARYIGRGSPYGNQFVIGEHGDREQVCNRFECEQLPDLDVSDLTGRDLVCYCAPHRCHGDSILLKANYRVLVFGGRDYGDRRTLFRVLDDVHARRKAASEPRLAHDIEESILEAKSDLECRSFADAYRDQCKRLSERCTRRSNCVAVQNQPENEAAPRRGQTQFQGSPPTGELLSEISKLRREARRCEIGR